MLQSTKHEIKNQKSKKVFLRERKRYTARRVSSARYAGGGYPVPGPGGGYPVAGWGVPGPRSGGRGTLSQVGGPIPGLGGTPFQVWGGTPSRPGQGGTLGTPQT